jgi:hypothetical protein
MTGYSKLDVIVEFAPIREGNLDPGPRIALNGVIVGDDRPRRAGDDA